MADGGSAANQQRVSALLVSPTAAYCDALARALDLVTSFAVVGIAHSADEALRATSACSPDLVVLDLPVPEGPLVCQDMRRIRPHAKVVAIGVPPARHEVLAWAGTSVAGCIAKTASLSELIEALQQVGRDEVTCSASLASALFAHARRSMSELRPANLTRREREIVRLLAEGLSNKEIAAVLHVQTPTVKNHVHNIFEKVGVHTRSEVSAWLNAAEPVEEMVT